MSDRRLTTADYLGGPETVLPQELVYGIVRDAAAPTPRHQWIVGNIYSCLRAHLEETRLGRAWISPIDVVLDRERGLVIQPDVIVMLNDRLHFVTDRVWGAPDLVVEVLSQHPRIGSLDERLEWFAKYGVRECWLVRHLADEFEVVSFDDGAIRQRTVAPPHDPVPSRLLPGISATPAALFSQF